jgi:hypothetical protein
VINLKHQVFQAGGAEIFYSSFNSLTAFCGIQEAAANRNVALVSYDSSFFHHQPFIGVFISYFQFRGVIAFELNSGGFAVERMHKATQNIDSERVNEFQPISEYVNSLIFFRQCLDGIYQFKCRCGVEVAIQFQTKAVHGFIGAYFEIRCHNPFLPSIVRFGIAPKGIASLQSLDTQSIS